MVKPPESGTRITFAEPELFGISESVLTLQPGDSRVLKLIRKPRFSQPLIKAPVPTKIQVDAYPDSSGVMVTTSKDHWWRQWLTTLFFQQTSVSPVEVGIENRNKHCLSVGEIPGQTSLVLGKDVVVVEFLGHQDVLLAELLDLQQGPDYNPELVVSYHAPDLRSSNRSKNEHKRTTTQSQRIILRTNQTQSILFRHDHLRDADQQLVPVEYQAQALVFIELLTRFKKIVTPKHRTKEFQPNAVRVGIALRGSDEKLRVYHSGSRPVWRKIEKTNGKEEIVVDDSYLLTALRFLQVVSTMDKLTLSTITDWPINVKVDGFTEHDLTSTQLAAVALDGARLASFLEPTVLRKKRKRKPNSDPIVNST